MIAVLLAAVLADRSTAKTFVVEPPTLVVGKSEASSTDMLSENAIFLQEIFNDVLLSLVQPTSNGNDEKRKWIQTGSHRRSVSLGMGPLSSLQRLGEFLDITPLKKVVWTK